MTESTNTTTETTTATPKTKKARKASAKGKKVSKKAAAKVAKPRGHKYELTAKGEKMETAKISPQQQFIHKALRRGAKTSAELATLAESDKKGFPTTQPAKRAIAFYLTEWKGKGLAKFASAA